MPRLFAVGVLGIGIVSAYKEANVSGSVHFVGKGGRAKGEVCDSYGFPLPFTISFLPSFFLLFFFWCSPCVWIWFIDSLQHIDPLRISLNIENLDRVRYVNFDHYIRDWNDMQARAQSCMLCSIFSSSLFFFRFFSFLSQWTVVTHILDDPKKTSIVVPCGNWMIFLTAIMLSERKENMMEKRHCCFFFSLSVNLSLLTRFSFPCLVSSPLYFLFPLWQYSLAENCLFIRKHFQHLQNLFWSEIHPLLLPLFLFLLFSALEVCSPSFVSWLHPFYFRTPKQKDFYLYFYVRTCSSCFFFVSFHFFPYPFGTLSYRRNRIDGVHLSSFWFTPSTDTSSLRSEYSKSYTGFVDGNVATWYVLFLLCVFRIFYCYWCDLLFSSFLLDVHFLRYNQ